MLYDCRDIGGFLEVTFLWIHPNPRTEIQLFVWGATGKSVGERREPTFLGGQVYSSFVISLSENEIDFGKSSHKSTS